MQGAEWDMSAPISAEDIVKAGGLGARDDIGSAVPVAADNTDMEETLMEFGAKETSHEGLGYTSNNEGSGQGADGGLEGSVLPGDRLAQEGLNDPNYLTDHFTKPVQEPTE